jgi:hypothetical protein
MSSVVKGWLGELPWKQQSIFFSGLRGPDAPTLPRVKVVNRWLRMISQENADPSKDYMKMEQLPQALAVCMELEFLPCHYVHHLADALAVVAYGHPDEEVAAYAARLHYRIAEELFHFSPEMPHHFTLRHRDKPGGEDPDKVQWAFAEVDAYEEYMFEALRRFRDKP